jgi:hypothetical protein
MWGGQKKALLGEEESKAMNKNYNNKGEEGSSNQNQKPINTSVSFQTKISIRFFPRLFGGLWSLVQRSL